MRSVLLCLALVLAVAVAGCERPFIDAPEAELRVISPDLGIVFDAASVRLVVEAVLTRDVVGVTAGTVPLTRTAADRWEGTVPVAYGVNAIVLRASNARGVAATDTAYALVLRTGPLATGPRLPEARGGATATRLADGAVLVTGGAAAQGEAASDAAFLLRPGAAAFETLPARLVAARSGHTATLLPDGTVLLAGGTRVEGSRSAGNLVETAELYTPGAGGGGFTALPVRGAPIRHVLHAALYYETGDLSVLYLVGGEGDIAYGTAPRYGVRDDARAFAIRGGSLDALAPGAAQGIGQPVDAAVGATALPARFRTPRDTTRYVVAGGVPANGGFAGAAYALFTSPRGLLAGRAPAPRAARTRHAGAVMADGFFALFGGRADAGGAAATVLADAEVYADEARRYFRLTTVPLERYGHGATFESRGRILLVGGFMPDGRATNTTARFTFDLSR